MNVRSMLVCEDVRLEVGGTMSLIGVYNDRIVVTLADDATEDDPIVLSKLSFVIVVAGLRGVETLAFRHRLRRLGDPPVAMPAMVFEAHAAEADEHNFVMAQSPMVLPALGRYEVCLDLDAQGALATFSYEFEIVA